VVIEEKSCVLALLYSNVTFHLTSIKPFYIGDIKAGSNSPKHDPEYHIEGEDNSEGNGGVGIIPPTISTNIPLKRGRG
jgi:hypothetical protein